jgi:uncharacterized protein YqjF (DUF2071 family)
MALVNQEHVPHGFPRAKTSVNRVASRALQSLASVGELLLHPAALVSRSQGQPRVLRETAHRPWPVPDEPWLMAQTWRDLLFAHWPVAADRLRPLIPEAIPLDERDGSAWVAVTPFKVRAFRLRGMPHLPGVTSFPELNVRTYTTIDGKPGIWFMSLDAASSLAVASARRAYRLPYFKARMGATKAGRWVQYRSRRVSEDGDPAELSGRYRPTGPASPPAPGSLEHWLTERYCLYALDERGSVLRADIHHPPWPLQPAEAEFELNTMAQPYGLSLEASAPLLHFARRQDVVIWPLRPLDGPAGA